MPLNKSTTYHQSVQFFVHFFSKKIVFLLSKKKKKIFKKNFLKIFFTQFYLKSTQFYHILLSFTSSGTQFYQIPHHPCLMTTPWSNGESNGVQWAGRIHISLALILRICWHLPISYH